MSVSLLIILLASLSVLAAVLRAGLELLASPPSDCAAPDDARCGWLPRSECPRRGPHGPAHPLSSPSPGWPVHPPPPTSPGVWQGSYGLRAPR